MTGANRLGNAIGRIAALTLLTGLAPMCYAAGIVFVRAHDGSQAQQRELALATQFYGIDLETVDIATTSAPKLKEIVERPSTVGLAIAADALALVDQKELLRALSARRGERIQTLILGVSPETDASLLRSWSGGAITGCERPQVHGKIRYAIDRLDGVTQQLTGLEAPSSSTGFAYFVTSGDGLPQPITEARDDARAFPMFVQAALQGKTIFLDCQPPYAETGAQWAPEAEVQAFSAIAPAMMFVRHCARERGWHALYPYANLTIDDPWLTEPYGHLQYKGLLGEMEKHNFHTTIAFIPWNFDRSAPEVVSLFRDHPDRFSITIHGDNHDHREFTDYSSKPLSDQREAMKQSLARMAQFESLTKIPFDKVMVFPHGIAPEQTLGALKTYNYLATVNSANVPTDRSNPPLLPFTLRPVTLAYGNFASVLRYPAEAASISGLIAVNQFLEKPLLFYCHHAYFENGIGAFDATADEVNRRAPDTRWRNLGEIMKHLYLLKERDDGAYDALAFTREFALENVSGRDTVFHVRKEESGRPAIQRVTVGGHDYEYRLQDGYLDVTIPVKANTSTNVAIEYANDLQLTSIPTSKRSVRATFLRLASDFRDMTMSRWAPGRGFVRLYYQDGATRIKALLTVAGLLCIALCGGLWAWRSISKASARANKTT